MAVPAAATTASLPTPAPAPPRRHALEPHQSNISAALGRDCVGARRYGRLTRMQMVDDDGDAGLSVWHRTHGASWAVIVRKDRGSGSTCVYPDLWTARWHMEGGR